MSSASEDNDDDSPGTPMPKGLTQAEYKFLVLTFFGQHGCPIKVLRPILIALSSATDWKNYQGPKKATDNGLWTISSESTLYGFGVQVYIARNVNIEHLFESKTQKQKTAIMEKVTSVITEHCGDQNEDVSVFRKSKSTVLWCVPKFPLTNVPSFSPSHHVGSLPESSKREPFASSAASKRKHHHAASSDDLAQPFSTDPVALQSTLKKHRSAPASANSSKSIDVPKPGVPKRGPGRPPKSSKGPGHSSKPPPKAGGDAEKTLAAVDGDGDDDAKLAEYAEDDGVGVGFEKRLVNNGEVGEEGDGEEGDGEDGVGEEGDGHGHGQGGLQEVETYVPANREMAANYEDEAVDSADDWPTETGDVLATSKVALRQYRTMNNWHFYIKKRNQVEASRFATYGFLRNKPVTLEACIEIATEAFNEMQADVPLEVSQLQSAVEEVEKYRAAVSNLAQVIMSTLPDTCTTTSTVQQCSDMASQIGRLAAIKPDLAVAEQVMKQRLGELKDFVLSIAHRKLKA